MNATEATLATLLTHPRLAALDSADKLANRIWGLGFRATCPRCLGIGHFSRDQTGSTECYRCRGRKSVSATVNQDLVARVRAAVDGGALDRYAEAMLAAAQAKRDASALVRSFKGSYAASGIYRWWYEGDGSTRYPHCGVGHVVRTALLELATVERAAFMVSLGLTSTDAELREVAARYAAAELPRLAILMAAAERAHSSLTAMAREDFDGLTLADAVAAVWRELPPDFAPVVFPVDTSRGARQPAVFGRDGWSVWPGAVRGELPLLGADGGTS